MPSRGDLIEISRGLYKHWAVYVGDGYVVHLVIAGSGGSFSSSSSSKSGTQSKKGKGKVEKEDLDDVVGNDRWRVNNKLDSKCRPRPAEEIVEEALSMVGDDVEYDVVEWNCEHFATKRRYGKSDSAQVDKGVKTIGGVLGGIIGGGFGLVAGPAGAVAGATAGAAFMNGWLTAAKKILH